MFVRGHREGTTAQKRGHKEQPNVRCLDCSRINAHHELIIIERITMNDLSHSLPSPALTLLINTHADECATLPLSWSELKAFPQHVLNDVTLTCLSGAEKGRLKNHRGALLRDVIGHIGLEAVDKRVLKQMLVIARARDNYTAIFSWNEIFNTSVGDHIFVLYEREGEGDVDISLISASDIRSAHRHVKGLKEIELRRMRDC